MTSVDLGWLEIERARYETLLDSLTGLPRWGLLFDRTTVALARARRREQRVAVFVLDDPRFADGSRDIRLVVSTLQSHLRPDDTLARVGDHRYVVVCNEITDGNAALVARRLILGTGLQCGLGVALGGDLDTPELVIGRALRAAMETGPDTAV